MATDRESHAFCEFHHGGLLTQLTLSGNLRRAIRAGKLRIHYIVVVRALLIIHADNGTSVTRWENYVMLLMLIFSKWYDRDIFWHFGGISVG